MDMSELELKQVFIFVGWQFNLREGKARLTLECWHILKFKTQKFLESFSETYLLGLTTHVTNRAFDSYREADLQLQSLKQIY